MSPRPMKEQLLVVLVKPACLADWVVLVWRKLCNSLACLEGTGLVAGPAHRTGLGCHRLMQHTSPADAPCGDNKAMADCHGPAA
eukprot:365707-Chlamydomonas_euryale.AAC.14